MAELPVGTTGAVDPAMTFAAVLCENVVRGVLPEVACQDVTLAPFATARSSATRRIVAFGQETPAAVYAVPDAAALARTSRRPCAISVRPV